MKRATFVRLSAAVTSYGILPRYVAAGASDLQPGVCADIGVPGTAISCSVDRRTVIAVSLELTQAMIDPLRDNYFFADTITMRGPLSLPGKALHIGARKLSAGAKTIIDVSAKAPPDVLLAPGKGNYDAPGVDGKNGLGADDLGDHAGTVDIRAREITAPLLVLARGGDGQDGQSGGPGGDGHPQAPMTDDYVCKREENFGGNPGSVGITGAHGGKAGGGGAGSNGGTVTIYTATPCDVTVDTSGGRHGKPGTFGPGGHGGPGQEGSFAWSVYTDGKDHRHCSVSKNRARTGDPGVVGARGDDADDRSGPESFAPEGQRAVRNDATATDFSGFFPFELWRFSLDWAALQYISGRTTSAIPTLQWISSVCASPTPQSDLIPIATQAREMLARALSGADIYGNPIDYVPTESAAAFNADLGPQFNALGLLDQAADRFSGELRRATISDTHIAFQQSVTADQIKVLVQSRQDLRNEVNAADALFDQYTSRLNEAMLRATHSLQAYDDALSHANQCGAGLATLIAVGTLLYGVNAEAGTALAAFSDLNQNLTTHSENRENLLSDGRVIWTQIGKVRAKYDDYVANLPQDERAKTVLAVDGSDLLLQVKRLQDSIKGDSPEAHAARDALSELSSISQARNGLIVRRAALRSRAADLSAQLEDHRVRQTFYESQRASGDVALRARYTADLELIRREARERVLEQVFLLTRAQAYLSASESIPFDVGDLSVPVLLNASLRSQQTYRQSLQRLNTDVKRSFTVTCPASVIKSLKERGEATITIQRDDAAFVRFSHVFAERVKLRFAGVSRASDVDLVHLGDASVKGGTGRWIRFSHRERGYPADMASVAGGCEATAPLTGVDNNGLPLSPVATWRVKVGNPQELRGLQSVEFTFDARARLISA